MGKYESIAEMEAAEAALFLKLREKLPVLRDTLDRIDGEYVYEELVYRFYHQSFKAYRVQEFTILIRDLLQSLSPDRPLNAWFSEIVKQGTGHTFTLAHNPEWIKRGRPMLEAFFHARFMLEMAVRYGIKYQNAEAAPRPFDYGWAAFLYLYGLR